MVNEILKEDQPPRGGELMKQETIIEADMVTIPKYNTRGLVVRTTLWYINLGTDNDTRQPEGNK